MTTLRTAIDELLQAVDEVAPSIKVITAANRLRALLGDEPNEAAGAIPTEDDGFRVEAAQQFGFQSLNDDCTEYRCDTRALLAFARGGEHAGMFQACKLIASARLTHVGFSAQYKLGWSAGQHAAEMKIRAAMKPISDDLQIIIATETDRYMTSQGYVRAPEGSDKLWVKPEPSPITAEQFESLNKRAI